MVAQGIGLAHGMGMGHQLAIKQIKYKVTKPIRILLTIFRMVIKFGLMGWIRIDFALLNTFATSVFYMFFEILIFLEKWTSIRY